MKSCNAKRRRQRRKTVKNSNRSNQQKSNFARSAHFLCTFLAVALHDVFFGGNVERFLLRFFFSLPLIFTLHRWPLAFLILSPRLQNFHVVLPTKKMSPLFFNLSLLISVALFLVELRWPAAYFFSVFLLLYIPNLWT